MSELCHGINHYQNLLATMSSATKPVIVLVHGAWHTPAHYRELIEQLRKAGFQVFCPLLPTCDDEKRLDSDLSTDAECIRSQVISLIDQARDVIMLLHSYGGAVGTEAIEGLSARERAAKGYSGSVVRLIYMCAFMLQPGESCLSASFERPGPNPVDVDEETGTTFLRIPPAYLFYGDLLLQHARDMEALLVRHSLAALVDEVHHPTWKDIPTTYLRATLDQVLLLKWQDTQIQKVKEAGVDIAVETFESSHSPYLSMPEKIVEAVERAL